MKSSRIVTGTWPTEGSAAFVRAAAMRTPGADAAALDPTVRLTLRRGDRNGGLLDPGEGFA